MQPPEHFEIFVLELPIESHASAAQQVKESDARQAQHFCRFASGYSLIGVEFQYCLLFDGAHKFRFRAFVDRAVRNIEFEHYDNGVPISYSILDSIMEHGLWDFGDCHAGRDCEI